MHPDTLPPYPARRSPALRRTRTLVRAPMLVRARVLMRGLALVALVGVAGPTSAAEDDGTVRVVRIAVEGNDRISDEAVLHLMTLKVGDPYDEAHLKEEFKRIWARGLFDDLSIESRDVEGGKAIIVHLVEKPVVNSLSYEESKVVGETQIEDALKNRNCQIAVGEPVDYTVLKKAEEAIKSLLNQKGYLDAAVVARTKETGNGNLEVKFEITEGSKTRIRSITFVGNKTFSSRRLKKALKNTKEHGMFTWVKSKDIYHPLKYDTDLRDVEALYNNNGFIDIELPPAVVRVVEEKTSTKEGKSKKWVAIEQKVEEGRQYRVGDMKVSGNTVFGNDELIALVPLRREQVYSEAAVKLGLSQVDLRYGARGYFYVSSNRLLDRHPEDGKVDLTIKINEDKQYHLDSIEFSGNLTTRDYVLRREIPLAEGELFDLQRFRLGLRRVAQLGYFQIDGEPTITPVDGKDRLKVTVTGTEPRRSELQVGGGYSGLDGGFFAVNYATRNFLGRGDLVTINGQIGSIATRYVLSFTEPYLFGRPITAGVSLFRRTTDYSGFTTADDGFSITLGRRLRSFHNLNVSLLSQTTDFDPRDGISSLTSTRSIRPFYSYDTRNNPYRPSRGHRFFFSTEYAGGALGGDNSFVMAQLEYDQFLHVRRSTFFAFHVELGYVTPTAGDPLPTFERFFLGGERSMRNFGTRTVGPSGFICNFSVNSEAVQRLRDCPSPPRGANQGRVPLGFFSDIVGGDRKVLFNAEYVIPISEVVDFVAYADVGNAFAEWEPYSFSDMRGDAGLEMRFFLPVFGAPLRLIYGQTFNTRGTEDTKSFLFSIGTTF